MIAGIDGAYCFHTLSDEERDLSKEEFEGLSRGWIAGSPKAYGNMKEAVEKLCSEAGAKCTYEVQQNFRRFFGKVDKVIARVPVTLPIPVPLNIEEENGFEFGVH